MLSSELMPPVSPLLATISKAFPATRNGGKTRRGKSGSSDFFMTLSLKNEKYTFKKYRNKQENLKVSDENNRFRSRSRIRTKLSRIRNTGCG